MGKLEGKVAIVTGSTAGIGRAIADLYADEGAQVVVNGRRQELGQEVVAGIRERGGTASYCRADITRAAEIEALVDHAVRTYGRLDIMVNNAWSGQLGTVLEVSEEEWDYLFSATLKACYLGSKYALPHLLDAGEGIIINISSVHGVLATKEFTPYDAAKAGIIQLTRSLAISYGKQGVRANAICPGLIMTEYAESYLADHPDYRRQTEVVYPLGRPGQPVEVARVALFLACDDSSFITGHALLVDGGLTIQLQDSLATKVAQAHRHGDD